MRYIIIVVLLSMPVLTRACDVCGSSAMDQRLGILPDFRTNVLRFSSQWRSFSTIHPRLFDNEELRTSNEYFQTSQLDLRWFITERWMLTGTLPYQNFQLEEYGDVMKVHGWGDASIGAAYLYTFEKEENKSMSQLLGALSLKLPTGQRGIYSGNADILIQNMQPGTGSYDLAGNIGYFLRKANWGGQLQATGRLNGENSERYQFGNRWTLSGRAMRWFENLANNRLTLIASTQILFASAEMDYQDTRFGMRNSTSGGESLLGGVQLSGFIGAFGVSVAGNLPIWEDLGGGSIHNLGQWSVQLSYLF